MPKLLVIDDDPAIRKLIGLELGDSYEVEDSGDPDEGLALALQYRPDAILVDLRMPKYSGYELVRTYSDFSQTQHVPVVIVSGEASRLTASQVKDLGAVAVFEKPIDFDKLRACLAEKIRQCKRYTPRAEVRVRLNIALTIKGQNRSGTAVEDSATTEHVTVNGFLCHSTAEFLPESMIEVFLSDRVHVGKAKVVNVDGGGEMWHYECRFLGQPKDWVLH